MIYDIVLNDGRKQVRFWPCVTSVSLAEFNKILRREFPGVEESKLRFGAGIVNFWVEEVVKKEATAGS